MQAMSRFLSCALLVSCAVASAMLGGPSTTAFPTAPFLAWSNGNTFEGRNRQANELMSIQEISAAFQPKVSSAEVVVVFVESQLRTEALSLLSQAHAEKPSGGAFPNLKGLVESFSESSISMPYSFAESGVIGSSFVSSLYSQSKGSITIVSNSANPSYGQYTDAKGSSFYSPQTLAAKLQDSKWSILHNGVTDIIVVSFDSIPADSVDAAAMAKHSANDQYMREIDTALKASGAKYVAVFTVETPSASIRTAFPESHPLLARFEGEYAQQQLGADDTLWPAELIEALIILFPFLLILLLGVCCTFGVQSALKFDGETKKKQ